MFLYILHLPESQPSLSVLVCSCCILFCFIVDKKSALTICKLSFLLGKEYSSREKFSCILKVLQGVVILFFQCKALTMSNMRAYP